MNYDQKESRRIVYFFIIYYGLTLVIPNLGIDSARYASRLEYNATLPFSDFFKIVGGIYATETSVDIVEPLISFIVSRFTTYHGVYFAVWSAIFGFFYLRSINLLYDHYKISPGWNSMIFLFFFIFILPFTEMNGPRMWTAAWIFFYGAYHVILYRDARYLLLALTSSLVHFSYFSANAVLLIYFFVGNRNLIYIPIVIVSFISPRIITPVFQGIAMSLGGGLQSRFLGYSNESYIITRHEIMDQAAWFIQIGNNLVFYYLILSILILKLRFRFLMKEKSEKNLFSFLLLFLAFVNFGKGIPSFGSRYQVIFFLFATLYLFLYFLKLPGNKIAPITLIGLFPILIYSAIEFRNGADTINAWILTPGLGLPFFVPGISLSDFLFH